MLRFFYNLLLHLALLFLPLRLWWRGRREPLYRDDWAQRFGRAYPPRRDSRPLIWLHAVSLGETRAAGPLLRALRERYPGHAFLITHMTATGRAAAQELYGDFAELSFLPYDYPWAVKNFLQHYRPVLGLVMETEIWPNLLRAAQEQAIPMMLMNARLSSKSARGYAKLGRLAEQSFGVFARVGAQSEDDAVRLRILGARDVNVNGNLKFDMPDTIPMQAVIFREWFGRRRVFLAASTREGEEALLLEALSRHPLPADVLTVIVPRHPQRFDEVADLLGRRGFSRRSAGPPAAEHAFWLGDSMGEMAAYYAACNVAFIGGSLLPYGAQNLIEACAVGTPVLLGPSTFNFAQAAEGAITAGAARSVKDADELVQTAAVLLGDTAACAAMKQAGLAFCAAHRGATARSLLQIEKLLPDSVAAQ